MPPRSRQTRHQDAASAARSRGIVDLDPTDGLPVQKYSLAKVLVNQDASADPSAPNAKSTNSTEWAAQFNTPQFPWSERPLPSFQKELPAWNQEMIRRARAGNMNTKLSVWDWKNDSWMSAAEAENKSAPAKSSRTNDNTDAENVNGKPRTTGNDADSTKSADDSDDDSSNESNKSGEDEDDADDIAPFKPSTSTKRRKLASRLNGPDETRLIEVKRWIQLPPQVAEKAPDPSFLAQRRPGMPPLYQAEYAQRMFGRYHSSTTLTGTMGYDLGEGGGLNNASGVLAAGTNDFGATVGTATPPRKNIPPRRKKKKLGGPGRKPKSAQIPITQNNGVSEAAATTGQLTNANSEGIAEGTQANDGQVLTHDVKEEEGALDEAGESGSEAEGSEEGEIDETGGASKADETSKEGEDPHPDEDVEMTNVENPKIEVSVPSEAAASPKSAIGNPVTSQTPPQPDAEPTLPTEIPEPSPPHISETSISILDPVDVGLSAHLDAAEVALAPVPVPAPAPSEFKEETIGTTNDILGLNDIKDPEEKQIVEEDAQALTKEGESPSEIQIEGVSQAIEHAAASAEEKNTKPENEGAAQTAELDLLGGLDAAIDEGMNEEP